MVVATQIKRGQVIQMEGELYRIIRLMHITPGKGNAVVQSDLRSLRTGVKTEKRFRSSEDVEIAHIETRKMQYLYAEGDFHHFMDEENYTQVSINTDMLGDDLNFMVPEQTYQVELFEGNPVGITLPSSVVLSVVQTDPPQKGDSGKTKPAVVNTGMTVKVPLFITEGENISVSTETGDYLERAGS